MSREGKVAEKISSSIESEELPALFFDFDGTLSEIVANPDDALLFPGAKECLEKMASRDDMVVGIVSGRALDDVKERVGVSGILYSGNHGAEIEVGEMRLHFGEKGEFSQLADFHSSIRARVKGIEGLVIEYKDYSLSIHVRSLRPSDENRVKKIIEETSRSFRNLTMREGKKLYEIVPQNATTKGEAMEKILDRLSRERKKKIFPVYFGDDVTDNYVYEYLRERGRGISVFVRGKDGLLLDADIYLDGPREVVREMALLAEKFL